MLRIVWGISVVAGTVVFGGSQALAGDDFDGDGDDELIIPVINERLGETGRAHGQGAVHVLPGSGSGPITARSRMWTQDTRGVRDQAEAGDQVGSDWVGGDFDGNGFGDLVIGVERENVGGTPNAGAVHVLYVTSGGLSAAGDQLWTQSSAGVASGIEPGDRFGYTFATGDFDGDGRELNAPLTA